ncbi:hypothetical protein [Enterococcus sp. AZ196]|uniref:hypothetical protein n=1 Tax=Enterococcus sp. AZ196 TaxID=2774659 RepID=UPI003D2E014D
MTALKVIFPPEEEKELRKYIFEIISEEFLRAKNEIGVGNEFWNSRKEVKKYLEIGDETLDQLILKGLPVIRLGERGFHFHKESVISWLLTTDLMKYE